MSKLLICDLDDTILKFSHHFENWCRDKKGYNVSGRVRETGDLSGVIGCNSRELDDLILEFSQDHSEFGILEAEEDAKVILPLLHRKGYQFIAISACIHGTEVIKLRRKNLEDAFGFSWLGIHCVGLKQPKESHLASYASAYWVEDNLAHALTGAALGHKTFLLDRPYNQSDLPDNIMRIKSWYDIFEEIIKDEPPIIQPDMDLIWTNPAPTAAPSSTPTGKYKTFNNSSLQLDMDLIWSNPAPSAAPSSMPTGKYKTFNTSYRD